MQGWLRVVVAAALLTAGCVPTGVPRHGRGGDGGQAAVGTWGFDLTGMDTRVRPGDDFYRYAVGGWIDRTPIPDDHPDWNVIKALSVQAEEDVRRVVERAAASAPAPGSLEQKVADAYASYLDTARIEKLGLAPFQADLASLRRLATPAEVAAAMTRPGLPTNGPILFSPNIDAQHPDRYALFVTQGGLGLPNRDFYLSTDAAFADTRAKYRDYIERMLSLAKVPDARTAATAVANLEKHIARIHWPLAKVRNRDLTYHPKSLTEIEAFAPGFPWAAAIASLGLRGHERFVLQEADAIAGLARLFQAMPVATWRAYLTFHYLHHQADIMPKAFDEARFAFVGTVLGGQTRQRERWQRAVGDINGPYGAGPLGEAVGMLYVADRFSPAARAAIQEIVANLLAAYQQRIRTLPWMSPETRKVAIRKAQTVRVKLGFPDRWKDYAALTIAPGDAYGNRKRQSLFESQRQLARLDQPTDKDEWLQGPQTVNAYYRAELNEIVFPAAILQPPFFDAHADPAVNYGAVGGVIGHEMGHGYDDQGAKSDEHGILRTWWQPGDEIRFRALTEALAKQYAAYEPLPGLHVNGEATSGENIGDLGGLSVAFAAYQRSLGWWRSAPVLDGLSGEQRFFLGWAQVWRGTYRDQRVRELLTSDVHAPMPYRVNGVVRNIDAWYDAFAVRPDAALYLAPPDRVRIW